MPGVPQRCHQREVAPGTVALQESAATETDARPTGIEPVQDRGDVVELSRKTVVGRQSVVDAQNG